MRRRLIVFILIMMTTTIPLVYANGDSEDVGDGTQIDIEANVDGFLDADIEFNAESGEVSINYNGENLLETISAQGNSMKMFMLTIKNERENEKLIEDLLELIEANEAYSVKSDNELYERDNLLASYIGITEIDNTLRIKIINGDTTLVQEIQALWAESQKMKQEISEDNTHLEERIEVLYNENQELYKKLEKIQNEKEIEANKLNIKIEQISNTISENKADYEFLIKDMVSAIIIFVLSIPIFKYKILV